MAFLTISKKFLAKGDPARIISPCLKQGLVGYSIASRFYSKDRYSQDEESKKYEKDMNDMIKQVNQELLQERMEVNTKFLKQQQNAEEEMEEKKRNTFNKYTTYMGKGPSSSGIASSKFEPDRPKSDAYKKQLLKKSMNYKMWVLSGVLLVFVFGGNDIYNYFMNQEKFVEMNDNIREVQLKRIAKRQEKLENRVKKLNKTLNSPDGPIVAWNNGDFSTLFLQEFKKNEIKDMLEEPLSKDLYLLSSNGDLYQYNLGLNSTKIVLKGHKLKTMKLSNEKLYLLNEKNEIEILPLKQIMLDSLQIKRSWSKPWVTFTVYDHKMLDSKGTPMYFANYDLGNSNFIGETPEGKIYSATTLSEEQQKDDALDFNKGQYGLPEYPPSKLVSFSKVQSADIEAYPSLDHVSNGRACEEKYLMKEDEPLEIELLTSSFFDKSNSILKRKIAKFSTGKNHSYFIDSNGSMLTFGDNSVGQMYLQKIGAMKCYPIVSARLPNNVKCRDVKCLGDNTYFLVTDSSNKELVLSCGSGMMGELGNAQFKINQADATKLLGLNEVNFDSVEEIGGYQDKRLAILESKKNPFKYLLLWGNNKNGELPGLLQGKRYNIPQQSNIKLPQDSKVIITQSYGTIFI